MHQYEVYSNSRLYFFWIIGRGETHYQHDVVIDFTTHAWFLQPYLKWWNIARNKNLKDARACLHFYLQILLKLPKLKQFNNAIWELQLTDGYNQRFNQTISRRSPMIKCTLSITSRFRFVAQRNTWQDLIR